MVVLEAFVEDPAEADIGEAQVAMEDIRGTPIAAITSPQWAV